MATYGQSCVRPMCVPPSYADLGKAARDIFNKGFGFGLVKLDVKTKSCSGVVLQLVAEALAYIYYFRVAVFFRLGFPVARA